MPDDQNAIIGILNNLQRDTSQIKTDLAVNTTRTGYIEEHLRTLNGKVIKQEEKQQAADQERLVLKEEVSELRQSKRRWNDGWLGVLKQVALVALGVCASLLVYYLTH